MAAQDIDLLKTIISATVTGRLTWKDVGFYGGTQSDMSLGGYFAFISDNKGLIFTASDNINNRLVVRRRRVTDDLFEELHEVAQASAGRPDILTLIEKLKELQ